MVTVEKETDNNVALRKTLNVTTDYNAIRREIMDLNKPYHNKSDNPEHQLKYIYTHKQRCVSVKHGLMSC